MPAIDVGEITVQYNIVRSKRRSLSMVFKDEYEIEVKAPRFIPEFLIKQFIEKNKEWLQKQLTKRQHIKQNGLLPEFKTGSTIPFFGEQYPITISTSELAKIPRMYFIHNSFQVIIHPDLSEKQKQKEIKKLFKDWYRDNMKDKLVQKVDFWARKMDVTYKTIRIKDVKGHWGSCSSKKNLNFNYRIAMLPIEGIDYIIVHELSHLTEMNHSSRFWNIVKTFMPNYKEIRSDLKKKSIEIE